MIVKLNMTADTEYLQLDVGSEPGCCLMYPTLTKSYFRGKGYEKKCALVVTGLKPKTWYIYMLKHV
jgi:hypothetical protein